MPLWKTDSELFSAAQRELFVAVVGDIMDKLGFQHQFLSPLIRPLRDDMVVIGRAMCVLEADIEEKTVSSGDTTPFGLMLDALDDLKPNEVYLCTGASPTYALWGELMSVRARQLGASGAVLDGFSRDTQAIRQLSFPTFSYGSYAQDQAPRGTVVDFRLPVEIGNVHVETNDVVFGDVDGVCVVPQQIVEEVFTGAFEKVRGEKLVLKELMRGMSAREAFLRYGIL